MMLTAPPPQLLLDLGAPPPPSLDNFIAGRNAELLHALRALVTTRKERSIYLWGEAGSGRSHLLKAVASQTDGRYVNIAERETAVETGKPACVWDDRTRVWCIDNVDHAGPEMQIALFNLINEVRAHGDAAIVIAGPAAPLQLSLREDLRSRLGWGLVFQLHPLNDAEKDAALNLHADERSLKLVPEIRQYLLTHFSRDMPTLMTLIDALDQYAMQQQRPINLPLLRAFTQHLQEQKQLQPDASLPT